MSLAALANAVWEHDTVLARTLRLGLAPASWLYGAIVARRNARFDAAVPHAAALPAISIGNLTVGGTGKTPVTAWCVQQLAKHGARPSIVLRGVGDDEWRVHELLNPGRPVVVSADRVAGMATAHARGADCVVLDDAFQHRQAARVADVVLVSADRWTGVCRLLPAGPFREPLDSLRRAHLVAVTVKAASASQVDRVLDAVRVAAPSVPVAVIRLTPDELHAAGEAAAAQPVSWLHGRSVALVCALGDPASFEAQVASLGADVKIARRYPDHHAFSATDAAAIARDAEGTTAVICTLKDAVKLGPLWPRAAPRLWYLSQSVVVDRGAAALDRVLVRLLAARATTAPTAG